jgi:hypothetical protein
MQDKRGIAARVFDKNTIETDALKKKVHLIGDLLTFTCQIVLWNCPHECARLHGTSRHPLNTLVLLIIYTRKLK